MYMEKELEHIKRVQNEQWSSSGTLCTPHIQLFDQSREWDGTLLMEQGPGHCATYTQSHAARSGSGTVGTILSEGGEKGSSKPLGNLPSYTTARGP